MKATFNVTAAVDSRSLSLQVGPVQVSLWRAPVGNIGLTMRAWTTQTTLDFSLRHVSNEDSPAPKGEPSNHE